MIGYLEQDVISKLRLVATMNKYGAKAGVWLALGADKTGSIRCVIFNNNPWVQSECMDRALEFYSQNTQSTVSK